MKKLITFLIISVLLIWQTNISAQTATEITNKMKEVVNMATDQKSDLKIVLTNKAGKESVRTATLKSTGDNFMLFRFTSPASQAGISILSKPNHVMYVYLPAYTKERRINSSSIGQKFAGTDFCYEDMETASFSDKYDATILSQNDETWTLQLLAKQGVRTVYSKLEIVVDKNNYYAQKIDFYHKKTHQKIKELINTKIEKINNFWIATESTMTDLKTGHKTKMIMSNIHFDNGFTEDDFTLRELKK